MSRRLTQQTRAGPSSTSKTILDIPAYEPPCLPLTIDSCSRLISLSKRDTMAPFLTAAFTALTSAGGDLGERVTVDNTENTPDAKKTELLAQMEAIARQLVDASNAVAVSKDVLTQLADTERQRTETARRRGRRIGGGDEDEDDDDDDRAQVVSHADGTWGRFRVKFDEGVDEFSKLTEVERYTNQAEYVDFRKTVWDAQHPHRAMPPVRQWFGGDGDGDDEDDDDDGGVEDSDEELEVAEERMSFQCPLTLRDFQDPVLSTVCHGQHRFERSAIMEVIKRASGRNQTVDCPVPGCNSKLTAAGLQSDRFVLQKMKRERERERKRREREEMQEEQEEEEEEEEEEEVDSEGDTLMKSPGEEAIKIKKEKNKRKKRQQRSRVVDVGEDEDE